MFGCLYWQIVGLKDQKQQRALIRWFSFAKRGKPLRASIDVPSKRVQVYNRMPVLDAMARWFCNVCFGFWHLSPKWFLCWMPWPNHFPLCEFQCLRFSFLYICPPVSHMHFLAKQVYVWQFLSAFGKERVRKLCWVSWFVSPPHGFSARCLGWMILLPIWGLCLWICLPQVC